MTLGHQRRQDRIFPAERAEVTDRPLRLYPNWSRGQWLSSSGLATILVGLPALTRGAGVKTLVRRIAGLLVILFIQTVLFAVRVSANTYYIDCAGGSDSNNGASTATPWLHHPYTSNGLFTGNYTHHAGDQFIFKGGVACTTSIQTQAGGSASANDYYGAGDKTWYSGASWTQPIFDGGGTKPGSSTTAAAGIGIFFSSGSYITVDNFKFTGLYWTGPQNTCGPSYIGLGTGTNDIIENNTFTGWTHGTAAQTSDSFIVICGSSSSPHNYPVTITHNTFYQSASFGDSGLVNNNGNGALTYNTIYQMTGGFQASEGEIAYNTIHDLVSSFEAANHTNSIYPFGCGGLTTLQVHDNLLYNVNANNGQTVWVEGGDGCSSYYYNNVVIGGKGQPFAIDNQFGDSSTAKIYIWNNTIVPQGANMCIGDTSARNGHSLFGTIDIENNHCITTGIEYEFSGGIGVANLTVGGSAIPCSSGCSGNGTGNELIQTPAAASSQGYTSANNYMYQPTSGTGATVGTAKDLSSKCPGISLCTDTTYGSDGRPVYGRVPGGRWDIGAFEFSGLPAPEPPTGLTATVN